MSLINAYRKKLVDMLGLHISIEKCEGNKIITPSGDSVRDYLSQYGALPFGHNPEFCVNAVVDHLKNRAPVFTQPILQESTEQYAKELLDALGGWAKHVTFTNSGAEAVEVAFKLARIKTGKSKILSVERSFHGKTYSALMATNSRRYNVDHLCDEENFSSICLNDLDALERELNSKSYAAFIVEPIQGEGGMHVADAAWLARARELCTKTRTALIFDEVQTGLGRAGGMCVAMNIGVTPDILLLAKALSGGLIATGAAIYSNWVSTPEFDRKHSSTFANNGLATCVGRAVIKELTKDNSEVLRHVKSISYQVDNWCEQLAKKHPEIFSWRGAGLMRSFQFHVVNADANYFVTHLQNSGGLAWVLCSYLVNRHKMLVMPLMSDSCSLRFEPALNTSPEDIDDFFSAISEICKIIRNGRYDILMAAIIGKPYAELPCLDVSCPVSVANEVAEASYSKQKMQGGKKFAFFMHITSVDDYLRSLPQCFHRNFTDEENRNLCKLIMEVGAIDYSAAVALKFCVSNDHTFSDGMMIMSLMSPRDMMELSTEEKNNLMKDYIAVARAEGAEFIGLGAYTSIITAGGTKNIDASGLSLTTGNSLTAMATTESVIEASGGNLIGSVICVIGARGAVGKLMVSEFAHWGDNIILMGRPGTEKHLLLEITPVLCRLAFDMQQKVQQGSIIHRIQRFVRQLMPYLSSYIDSSQPVPDWVVSDVTEKVFSDGAIRSLGLSTSDCYETALGQADYVVSATSEGKPFLRTEFLKKGALAVDTARPFDFVMEPGQSANVLEGGLVEQPNPQRYGDCNLVGLPPGVNLACLSETIALALAGYDGHFSLGKSIDYSQARSVIDVAREQGFRPLIYSAANPDEAPEIVVDGDYVKELA